MHSSLFGAEFWGLIVSFFAAMTLIGVTIDKLLLASAKIGIYDWAITNWIRLSETKIPDLAGYLAYSALILVKRYTRSRWRVFIFSILLSISLTGIAAIVGKCIRLAILQETTGEVNIVYNVASQYIYSIIKYGSYIPALFVNWLFDVTTVMITVVVLKHIVATRSTYKRFLFLTTDLLLALFLAFGCLVTAHLFTTILWGGTYYNDIPLACSALVRFLLLSTRKEDAIYIDDAFYASTTLLPTIAFLLVFGLLLAAKMFIEIVLYIVTHWMKLIADPAPEDVVEKLKPFTLLGSFFGLIGAIVSAIVVLFKLLYLLKS